MDLPVAIVADRRSDGRIDELRICFSKWPLDRVITVVILTFEPDELPVRQQQYLSTAP